MEGHAHFLVYEASSSISLLQRMKERWSSVCAIFDTRQLVRNWVEGKTGVIGDIQKSGGYRAHVLMGLSGPANSDDSRSRRPSLVAPSLQLFLARQTVF